MEEAVSLVKAAAQAGKKVLVHGDYDVDGVSGTAMAYLFLKGCFPEVFRFLPDRRKDGYGLSRRAVDWAVDSGVGLFIAVDCGVSDGELVSELQDHGIDVIICDHHEFPVGAKRGGTILNPVRRGERYPFKYLCGSGVAFKLFLALERSGFPGACRCEDLLDLLALATIGDLVPLVRENRYYVREGLGRINQRPRTGLEALCERAGLKGREIGARHISYVLAPRLNAPGRVSHSKPALEILCTDDRGEAERLASILERENEKRKELTEIVRRGVEDAIREIPDRDERGGYILAREGWDEGVLGIAASRAVEKFGKPAILISLSGETAKGSGRSVPGVNLKEALDRCKGHLLRYGGHAQAVGITIEAKRIEAFQKELSGLLRELTLGLPAQPVLQIDADLGIEECTEELLEFLSICEPFGSGNREPVWRIRSVSIDARTALVGNGHMKFHFRDRTGRSAEGISFNWEHPVRPEYLHGRIVDLAVIIKRGWFLERAYPEIRVLDIRHPEQGATNCAPSFRESGKPL